jgi:hypothetical protein
MTEIPEPLRITGRKLVSELLDCAFITPQRLSDIADNIARAIMAREAKARDEALEEAEKVANSLVFTANNDREEAYCAAAIDCATAIRAMKGQANE